MIHISSFMWYIVDKTFDLGFVLSGKLERIACFIDQFVPEYKD